jgi:hypothetical protein
VDAARGRPGVALASSRSSSEAPAGVSLLADAPGVEAVASSFGVPRRRKGAVLGLGDDEDQKEGHQRGRVAMLGSCPTFRRHTVTRAVLSASSSSSSSSSVAACLAGWSGVVGYCEKGREWSGGGFYMQMRGTGGSVVTNGR